MLILSQDKGSIINLDRVDALHANSEGKVFAEFKGGTNAFDCYEELGHYKTYGRAREVLKEIFDANDYRISADAHADGYGNTQLTFNSPENTFEMPWE